MFSSYVIDTFSFTLNTIPYITHLKNGRENEVVEGGCGGVFIFNRPQREGINGCNEHTHIEALSFGFTEAN